MTEYKEWITTLVNRDLVKEHVNLHKSPKPNSVKHLVLIAEMIRRGMRHILHKNNLDEKWLETMENLSNSRRKK